eukprot:4455247-Amphidinium_carterae.2
MEHRTQSRHWPAVEVVLFRQWALERYEEEHVRILKSMDEAHGTWTFARTWSAELVDECLHTHTHERYPADALSNIAFN